MPAKTTPKYRIAPYQLTTLPSALITWRPGLNDPDFLGIVTTLLYFVAAIFCFYRCRPRPGEQRESVWLWLGVTILALGFNKQLDFQTLLIQSGREITKIIGLYSERLILHQLLFLTFACTAILLLFRFFRKHRKFFKSHPFLSFLLVLLASVILTRSASIDHILKPSSEILFDNSIHYAETIILAIIVLRLAR